MTSHFQPLLKQRNNIPYQMDYTLQNSQNHLPLKKSYKKLIPVKQREPDTLQTTPEAKKSSEKFQDWSQQNVEAYFKISQRNGFYRHALAHKDGGQTCDDPKQIEKLRSTGKQLIKLIGKKILTGEFNLTKLSIPIKVCYPKTALYNSVMGYSILPYFMKYASECKDPLQRFKIVLACSVAQPYYLNMFLKPLNPIIGETLQASLEDGTQIYAEQISHHPPVSYFYIVGPANTYVLSGYYEVQVHPGLNSLTIQNKGKRKFTFGDGGQIQTTYAPNVFNSTFIGTSRVQQVQYFEVIDKKNRIECAIQYGKIKKQPSDYFVSEIKIKQLIVSQIEGTYLGFLDIDGKRYWDGRDIQPKPLHFQNLQKRLPSDWLKRTDIQALEQTQLESAQKCKESLQQIQRNDAKLRKKYQKQ